MQNGGSPTGGSVAVRPRSPALPDRKEGWPGVYHQAVLVESPWEGLYVRRQGGGLTSGYADGVLLLPCDRYGLCSC